MTPRQRGRFIEDGERVAARVDDVRPAPFGFIVRYQAEECGEREAFLPLPLPAGTDGNLLVGRCCRLELVEDGARIVAVHSLASRR